MNITVTCTIRNDRLDEIAARIPELAEDAIGKVTYYTQEQAKQNAPVDTGALRNSISAEVDGLTGFVFTGLDYAGYVEFGTYKMAANPFMRRAAEAGQRELDRVTDVIVRAIG